MASPSMHWTFGLPTNPTRTAPGLAGAVEAGEKQKKITVVRGGVDGSFAGTQGWFWIEPLKSKHINWFTMQANEFMVFWQSPGVYFNLNKYVQLSPANQNREKYVRQCSECLHTHLWSYKIDYRLCNLQVGLNRPNYSLFWEASKIEAQEKLKWSDAQIFPNLFHNTNDAGWLRWLNCGRKSHTSPVFTVNKPYERCRKQNHFNQMVASNKSRWTSFKWRYCIQNSLNHRACQLWIMTESSYISG